ncbi:MAG: regulator SirB [Gammaproteobacteria bacterium]|nr:regulator SirB [Gammaproteobacteria bacterium]
MVLKFVHVSCAALSITGFLARSTLKFFRPHLLQRRWLKISPHVIDTILLASAIGLVIQIRQYPFVADWVTAKVIALLFYIGFGMWALRFSKNRAQLTIGFVGACLTFSYIIAVAITRQAWPFT